MEMSPTPASPTGSNKNIGVIIAIIVLILAGGAYWLMQNKKVEAPQNETMIKTDESSLSPETTTEPTEQPSTTEPMPTTTEQGPIPTVNINGGAEVTTTPPPASSVKTFNITGGNFSFSPNVMKVKKGDTVRVNFTNEEGMHDWKLDEFNAKTPIISAGKTATVEFIASKSGSFEFYCSVNAHRKMGMKGTLTVE
ncbi:MAG: cupredoxin domain-containing protein [Patescibacteria group bacterium]